MKEENQKEEQQETKEAVKEEKTKPGNVKELPCFVDVFLSNKRIEQIIKIGFKRYIATRRELHLRHTLAEWEHIFTEFMQGGEA